MNPINFNDVFEKVMSEVPPEGLGMMPFPSSARTIGGQSERMVKDWRVSPLFDYVTTREREKALVKGLLVDESFEERPWPFNTFRLSMVETANETWEERGLVCGTGKYKLDALVTRYQGAVYILGYVKELFDEKGIRNTLAPMVFYIHELQSCHDPQKRDQYWCKMGLYAAGQWRLGMQIDDWLKETWQGVVDSVSGFLMDAMSPTNHIVQVQPVAPSKSVHWIHARTHYTLITHGHPANKREVTQGERVKSDSAGELTRMAHNRRAHYRTLRSERFRFAKGKRIFVKATWVGPKEWKDEGGKQIYRILEEVT